MNDKLNALAIEAIQEGDEDMVLEVLDKAKEEGVSAVELLKDGFAKGMEELGEQFAEGEIFLPELILAAEAMKLVTDRVEEEVAAGAEMEKKGTVVIGTVQDDVHDIGKAICSSMLKSTGFEVYDLGKQVPVQDFVDKAKEVNADIIGASALLTTTMEHQKAIVQALKDNDMENVKTMVGGAPVSQAWADQIGADGYSSDAITCCQLAEELASA